MNYIAEATTSLRLWCFLGGMDKVAPFRKENCLGVQASKSTYKSNYFGAFFMANFP